MDIIGEFCGEEKVSPIIQNLRSAHELHIQGDNSRMPGHSETVKSESSSPIGVMYSTMKQYGIDYLVHQTLDNGRLPSHSQWKKDVCDKITKYEHVHQQVARQLYPSLSAYNIAIGGIELCSVWELAVNRPTMKAKSRSTMSFICAYDAW